MKTTLDWILARLSENSTWRGIILVLTSTGVAVQPDLANAIIAVGLALVGLINIVRNSTNANPPVG